MTDSPSAFSRYRRDGSHAAFREVVVQYLPMVYGVALRLGGGNPAEAEDVAQMVFADLARKASQLRNEAAVGAWLHRHACFLMKNEIRGNVRRRSREQSAAEQWPSSSGPAAALSMETSLTDLRNGLDQCLESLHEPERRALILRFFEDRSLREVGEALGIGEDAAQKRVSRALERLRRLLGRHSVSGGVSLAVLTAFLSGEVRAAVPGRLALTLPASSLRLAAVRRGPLVGNGSRLRTAGPLTAMSLASLCALLAGWYFWKNGSPGAPVHLPSAAAARNEIALRPPGGSVSEAPPTPPEAISSVLERLRALSREPATSENAAAILALIAAVPPRDLPALAQGIADTGVTGMLYRSFPGLFQHWANQDTPAAMDWLFRQASDEELSFVINPSWEAAFQVWMPRNPKALYDWFAACMALRIAGSGPFFGVDTGMLRRISRSIAVKDPGNLETFLASFPDDPSFDTPHTTLKSELRNYTPVMLANAKHASAVKPPPDAVEAERAAPTPGDYPGLRMTHNIPDGKAAALMAENLRAWSRLDGPAALTWVSAHLDLRTAGSMLDEVVPVWAQSDPEGLRAWYLANKDLHLPVGGDSLTEKIIRALAVNDPVAATDFLVNQCGTLEVQMTGGMWGSIQVASDIAAGLSSADQCRRVIALLKAWPNPQDQEIQRLQKAALSRWKRWDPAGAEAAASP